MDEDIFCSSRDADDFCANNLLFKIAKISWILYRILAGMEGTIIISPDVGNGQTADMRIKAVDGRLDFG